MIDSEGMFGAEYVIYYLLPALRNLGANVHFACMCPRDSPGADLGRRLEQKGIPVFYLDERKKFSIKGLYSIYRALRRQADVSRAWLQSNYSRGLSLAASALTDGTTYHAECETYMI